MVQLTALGEQTIKVIKARKLWLNLRDNPPQTDDFWFLSDHASEESKAFNSYLHELEIEHAMEKEINEAISHAS